MRQIVLLFGASLCLCGCASSGGYPDNPTTEANELSALAMYFEPKTLKDYYDTPATEKLAKRNEIIFGRMAAYDLEYAKFQQDINKERALTDTAGDLTNLTLTALGASLVSNATKTALSAAATGVTGAKGSFDKNFFYEKALPALFAQMDANRALIRSKIEQSVAGDQTGTKYPLNLALADLYQYREAGSIPGALNGITSTAGAITTQMKIQSFSIRSLTPPS